MIGTTWLDIGRLMSISGPRASQFHSTAPDLSFFSFEFPRQLLTRAVSRVHRRPPDEIGESLAAYYGSLVFSFHQNLSSRSSFFFFLFFYLWNKLTKVNATSSCSVAWSPSFVSWSLESATRPWKRKFVCVPLDGSDDTATMIDTMLSLIN